MYVVYIVRCSDSSLYVGITNNLRKRLVEHNQGRTPFTKNRRPIKLVHQERFNSRKEAAKREKEIKGWRREKKEESFREI